MSRFNDATGALIGPDGNDTEAPNAADLAYALPKDRLNAMENAFNAATGKTAVPPATDDTTTTKPAVKPTAAAKAAAATKPAVKTADEPVDALEDLLGAPEVKPPVEEEEDVDPLTEFPAGSKQANFARMREVLAATHTSLKEAKAALKAAQAATPATGDVPPDVAAELASLKAKVEEQQAYVRAADVTLDPEFKAKFVDGRNNLIAKAADRITEAGGEGAALKEALALTGKKRSEAVKDVLSTLDDYDRSRVARLIDQVEDLDEQKADAIKDAGKAWETINAGRQQQTAAQQKAAADARVAEISKVAEKLPDEFVLLRKANPTAKDADAWNAEITAAHKEAARLTAPDAPAAEVAKVILMGLRAAKLQELFLAERKARIAAQGTVDQKARLSAAPAGRARAAAAPGTKGDYLTPAQRWAKTQASE